MPSSSCIGFSHFFFFYLSFFFFEVERFISSIELLESLKNGIEKFFVSIVSMEIIYRRIAIESAFDWKRLEEIKKLGKKR